MGSRRLVAAAAAAAAMAVFLLLSGASHGGRRGPSVNNSNNRTFVFNYTLAKTIVEYASAVYMTDLTALYSWTCSRCNDLTKYLFSKQGFEIRCIIVDIRNCLQAFIGVDHNLNAVIVAIRGTQENSVQNWIKDLVWKQVDLNYPNMPNAKVHTGFYSAYNNTLLRPAITNAVRKARRLYGDISVIVTGHSMGGAMASFCALDLAISLGSDSVHLMTFGQPRIGNAAFASYFEQYVPSAIRVTHEHDIVPHLPPYFFFLPHLTYHHFPREVWEHNVDGNTTFRVCDGSGEDPNCCRSVFALFLSVSDHLTYMGVEIAADDWSSCRIVMAQSVERLQLCLASNIIMSKNPVDIIIAGHSVQTDPSSSS
ncbi:lipase-like isoform X1 [Hordeum vulgare subsp. vulgare]|uniref:lipase-like isoform X1 n=1 Tax=Hordeum vulgare subsp. vulgare TaxID=112509 RepID=UPI001D1A3ACC|nr:lipase-like isoform X1 [Hordeum vulgare subsp. vulgare]